MIHFVIRKGGMAARAPVDDIFALVDQPFLIELHEHLAHGTGQIVVHGETLARPVHRGAERLNLIDDAVPVFLFPCPYPFDEGFASHIVAAFALFCQRAFHHVLGGDSGVIRTGNPQHFLALLAGMATEDILERMVQRMSDMQRAGYVRRGNDDGIGFSLGVHVGREGVVLFPVSAPVFFHVMGFVRLGQRHVSSFVLCI